MFQLVALVLFSSLQVAPTAPPTAAPSPLPAPSVLPSPTAAPECKVRNRKAHANDIGGAPNMGTSAGQEGTGSAGIAVWVDENGEAKHFQVFISSGNPEIDNRDLEAAEIATYTPEIKNCVAIKEVIVVYPENE